MEGCPPLLLSILNTNSSSALLTVLFGRTAKSTYSFAHIWAEELLVGTEPMSCRALTTAVAIVVLSEAKWS